MKIFQKLSPFRQDQNSEKDFTSLPNRFKSLLNSTLGNSSPNLPSEEKQMNAGWSRITNFMTYVRSFPLLLSSVPSTLFPFLLNGPKTLVLPQIGYKKFLIKLEEAQCKQLLYEITSFLEEFSKDHMNLTEEEQGKKVHAFIDSLEDPYLVQIWNQDQIDAVNECLEKYIMEKLYVKVFCQTDDHIEKDIALFNKIQSLQFITTDHLDINPKFVNKNVWARAQEDLLNINSVKSPRSKIRKILQCCKLIFEGLNSVFEKDKLPSVEDFLPIFIFCILKSNPPALHSNIAYLSHFRHPSRMFLESGYYFVSFLTAVSFIETINSSVLSISPEEFLLHTESSKKPYESIVTTESSIEDSEEMSEWVWIPRNPTNQKLTFNSEPKKISPRELAEKDPEKLSIEEIKEIISDYKSLLKLVDNNNKLPQ